jgi:hypothetical protein
MGPEEVDPSSPFSRAIFGGRLIGPAFLQGGPARYLWADEVREIAGAFEALTREELRRRFEDPNGPMKTGYKKFLKRRFHSPETLDDALFDELSGYAEVLATYYRIATARSNAMLLALV